MENALHIVHRTGRRNAVDSDGGAADRVEQAVGRCVSHLGFLTGARGMPPPMEDHRFPFRFSPPYRVAGLAFGVTPSTCEVCVGAGKLLVRFGPWRVETELDNIVDATITGPYTFIKTAGPARLSLADRGLTFATNSDRGVCLTMKTPVRGIDPFGLVRHPGVTVTVEDCQGLATAVQSR